MAKYVGDKYTEKKFITEIQGKTVIQLKKLIKNKYPQHTDLLKINDLYELQRKLNWRIAGY